MILSSFKLQNPLTARKDKNVRSKNIRRLESGWRRKFSPKTLPSRGKEFILENPIESAVIGVASVLGARYLIKGLKAKKLAPNVLAPNNKIYDNPIISTLKNSKQALDNDISKVKNIWNGVIKGKAIPESPVQVNKVKLAERKQKITSQLSDKYDSKKFDAIQKQIRLLRSKYIDGPATRENKQTTYIKGLTTDQIQLYQNQVRILTSKIRQAGQKAGSGYRRKNKDTGINEVVIKDSSYNLKSSLTFF